MTQNIFDALQTSLDGISGVNASDVNKFLQSAVDDLNASSTLVAEINDLTGQGWNIVLSSNSSTPNARTLTGQGQKLIEINVDATALSTSSDTSSNVTQFVGELAYELGHAEDPQLNNIGYAGNALAIGANVALDMLSEAKSLYNNIQAQKDDASIGVTIPLGGNTGAQNDENANFSNPTQAILAGAGDLWNGIVTLSNGQTVPALDYYWNLESPLVLPYITLANSAVLTNLQSLNMINANGLTFAQHSDGITVMRVSFSGGNISSYTDAFANYGAITPPGQLGGAQSNPQGTWATQAGIETYQIFDFTNGQSLTNAYNTVSGVNPDQTSASYSEAIYQTSGANGTGNLIYGQFDQTDANNNVTSFDIVGQGDIATISNVANVNLENGHRPR